MTTEVTLPNDTSVRTKRSFNAPPQLVWDAHTKPEFVQRWLLGPDGWSMSKCEIDFRVGGQYAYRWRNNESGYEFGMTGEFKEIVPISLIRHSEQFEEAQSAVTFELTERGGVSTLTMTMDFGSKEARDAAVKTGMTDGMEIGYRRLDKIAAEATQ